MNPRFEDDRAQRRNHAGTAAGATAGTALGLVAGAVLSNLLPNLGGGAGPILGGAMGLMLGALVGRMAVSHVAIEEMDPGPSSRPFVGAHTPDDDFRKPPPRLRETAPRAG